MDDLITHDPDYAGLTRVQAAEKYLEIVMGQIVNRAKMVRLEAIEKTSAADDLLGDV